MQEKLDCVTTTLVKSIRYLYIEVAYLLICWQLLLVWDHNVAHDYLYQQHVLCQNSFGIKSRICVSRCVQYMRLSTSSLGQSI